jgi:antitoxin component YwqK of YwqJK toxin-antitoxin module
MKKLFVYLLLICVAGLTAQDNINNTDSNGKKQGKWIKRDKNDFIQYIGNFKDDVPVGTFRYYYPYKDTFIRSVVQFIPNTNIAWCRNYHLNRQILSEGKFVNQEKDSIWTFLSIDGITVCKEYYSKDKKNGVSVNFYPSGKVFSETNYKDDIKQGVFKEYYEDGKLKTDGNHKNGEKDGKFVFTYPSGIVAAQGIYSEGKKHLVWNYNTSANKPEPREVYNLGKLLEGKAADEFLESVKKQAQNKKTEDKNKPKGSGTQKKATGTSQKK